MKIEVISCNENWWYNNLVGKIIKVEKHEEGFKKLIFKSRTGTSYGILREHDCQIVTKENTTTIEYLKNYPFKGEIK